MSEASPWLWLLHRGQVGRRQELLKVLFPQLHNIPSPGQQFLSPDESNDN